MARFVSGFLTASVLWTVGLLALFLTDILVWPFHGSDLGEADPLPRGADASVSEDGGPQKRSRRRRRRSKRGRRGAKRGGNAPRGDAVTGDDLREGQARHIDMEGGSGGEARLSPGQIDAAFGQRMGAIRRCLLHGPDDADMRGRVVFGLRIGGGGQVVAVNLSGPAVLTAGQTGSCLRRTARSIPFPSFDGPEMVARFPITFE